MNQDRLEVLADAIALADGFRDDTGTVTEQSSAGLLLPKGPIPKGPKTSHAFRGTDTLSCSLCGEGATAAIHRTRSGKRSVKSSGFRVGPKGYIHGWIFVGIPTEGAKVFHPHVGHGTVSRVRDMGNGRKAVSVKWHSGHFSSHDAVEGRTGEAPRLVPPGEAHAAPRVPQAPAPEIPKVEPPAIDTEAALRQLEEDTHREAMSSTKTAAEHFTAADAARTRSSLVRRAQGSTYSHSGVTHVPEAEKAKLKAEENRQNAIERGLRRAANDKAKAEAASHDSLVPAKGWRKLSDAEAHQHISGSLIKSGVNPQIAHVEAHRLSSTHETHVLADASLVHFNNSTKVTPAKKKVVLETVESLRSKYADKPPLTVYVGSGRAGYDGKPKRFGARVGGYAILGQPNIWVAPRSLQTSHQVNQEKSIAAGWHMPAGAGVDSVAYVLAHEYGHTIDRPGHHSPEAMAAISGPEARSHLSTYGKSNTAEAYAESHAEWFLSDGKTTNPTVRALAKAEGWK